MILGWITLAVPDHRLYAVAAHVLNVDRLRDRRLEVEPQTAADLLFDLSKVSYWLDLPLK